MAALNRRQFLKYFSVGTASLAFSAFFGGRLRTVRGQSNLPKLNFILINVDDLGWTDLSCQGSTYYETPNIDRLAGEGMRFTNGYAACAVCSPTRAALMTGRYPARVGITDYIPVVRLRQYREAKAAFLEEKQHRTAYIEENDKQLLTPPNHFWLDLNEITIPEMLKPAGYVSCHIGKWHLGDQPWYPDQQGFDYNIGGCDLGQPPSYFDPYHRNAVFPNIPTLPPRREGEYLTDRETDEAVRFLREHRDQPFFLYMAHYAVHTPIQGKEELVEQYKGKPNTNQTNAAYAAMVKSVDESTGQILETLDDLDLTDRTVVIFTSDNGGLEGPTDNAPLRSGKGYPYEGGIRVPVMVRWPGVVESATISYQPVISMDFFPTIVEAAGLHLPDRPIDGISLVDHLKSGGQTDLGRPALYWHFPHYRLGHEIPPYGIIRAGDWKLIKWYKDPTYELYNLQDDLGEQHDLAETMPGKVRELDEMLSAWLEEAGANLPRPNPEYDPMAEQAWWQQHSH